MFYPIGFGGSSWLLYIGVPLIIGIWAQIRVSSAFSKWGKVRATSNITGAECAREILQAAQIHDVDVVQTDGFLGDHYDPASKEWRGPPTRPPCQIRWNGTCGWGPLRRGPITLPIFHSNGEVGGILARALWATSAVTPSIR